MSGKCKMCKFEDTYKCYSCGYYRYHRQQEYEETSIERAIEFLEEENSQYEERLGDMAIHLEKYRINRKAIEALRKLL